ncbi:hypothetical protein ACNHYB_00670 [Isoptericola jiangsuensis]|uniref:hypothetical protein n=1 Tax=Isoptericola jiangsuensis TaxID=548579 RepID=UPI003AAFE163
MPQGRAAPGEPTVVAVVDPELPGQEGAARRSADPSSVPGAPPKGDVVPPAGAEVSGAGGAVEANADRRPGLPPSNGEAVLGAEDADEVPKPDAAPNGEAGGAPEAGGAAAGACRSKGDGDAEPEPGDVAGGAAGLDGGKGDGDGEVAPPVVARVVVRRGGEDDGAPDVPVPNADGRDGASEGFTARGASPDTGWTGVRRPVSSSPRTPAELEGGRTVGAGAGAGALGSRSERRDGAD